MYHFLDLTDAEKHTRRELLDHYAFIAQISILVPLAAVTCRFLLSRLGRRWADPEEPTSPRLKQERLGHWTGSRGLVGRARKLGWWLGGEMEGFGRRGQILGAGLWMVWLLGLCFVGTGEDYLHLTKRFGIVAASQLPVHYLLAMKSPYSPLQLLTRSSHEVLNPYHQFLGRIITILLSLHATFYLNFYIQSSLLVAKIQEPYVLCGIVGILSFTAIGSTALEPVRRWSYRVFYFTHVAAATALLPILFFHVGHIRVYLYEVAVVYCLNVLLRSFNSKTVTGTVQTIPQTSLVDVRIPLKGTPHQISLGNWKPGQHAYLSLAGRPASRVFRSNPFTVASIPPTDGELRFCARALNGNTARLSRHADTTTLTHQLTVEGPYGAHTHEDQLMQYDRVLFVAGGIGATFVAPLYRQLLSDLSPSRSSHRRQKVTFVWIARSTADVTWALPEDVKEREGFVERLQVHITRGEQSSGDGDLGMEEGVELEERKNLLSGGEGAANEKPEGMVVQVGRPRLGSVVDQVFSHGASERVAVIVCGPKNLSWSLRKQVGRWVDRGREVWFWEEVFAM